MTKKYTYQYSRDMKKVPDAYMGNPLIKAAGVEIEFKPEEIKEFIQCANDPMYFIENYVKIVHVDRGLIPFKPYPFQVEIIQSLHNNRFTICRVARQSGKTIATVSYLLHYAMFNKNVNVAILANKVSTAKDILDKLKKIYENLPKWLQQGVVSWNKTTVELENGSKIMCAPTSSSAIRGFSANVIMMDEFAFIPNNVCEEFFSSVYPVIASGKTTKLIIVSTPNGMNMFYKYWMAATSTPKRSEYHAISADWRAVPGRDEAWKAATIANTSEDLFRQEFEVSFIGSVNTLIHPDKLNSLAFVDPIWGGKESDSGLLIYKKPESGHTYTLVADVSRGLEGDYSAFVIFDITQMPYQVVATYRNNVISPYVYPNIIERIGKQFNNAYVLIENNDSGGQVCDILQQELEYENILSTKFLGRGGQIPGVFTGRDAILGVKTSESVKRLGCSLLKSFIENDKIIVNDFEIVKEMTSFVQDKASFRAESGAHDDLVMCCVLFAWFSASEFFKEETNLDVRRKIFDKSLSKIDDEMPPAIFFQHETSNVVPGYDKISHVDEGGNVWYSQQDIEDESSQDVEW